MPFASAHQNQDYPRSRQTGLRQSVYSTTEGDKKRQKARPDPSRLNPSRSSPITMKKKTPVSIRFVLFVLFLCIFGALGNAGRAFAFAQNIAQGDTTANTLCIAYLFLAAAASYLVVALSGRHKGARALTITYFVVAFVMFGLLAISGEEIGLFPSPDSLDANGMVVRGVFPLLRLISFVVSIVCLVGSSGAKRYLAASDA